MPCVKPDVCWTGTKQSCANECGQHWGDVGEHGGIGARTWGFLHDSFSYERDAAGDYDVELGLIDCDEAISSSDVDASGCDVSRISAWNIDVNTDSGRCDDELSGPPECSFDGRSVSDCCWGRLDVIAVQQCASNGRQSTRDDAMGVRQQYPIVAKRWYGCFETPFIDTRSACRKSHNDHDARLDHGQLCCAHEHRWNWQCVGDDRWHG